MGGPPGRGRGSWLGREGHWEEGEGESPPVLAREWAWKGGMVGRSTRAVHRLPQRREGGEEGDAGHRCHQGATAEAQWHCTVPTMSCFQR